MQLFILKLEVNVPDPLPHGEPLGIDLGLEKFLATLGAIVGKNIGNY